MSPTRKMLSRGNQCNRGTVMRMALARSVGSNTSALPITTSSDNPVENIVLDTLATDVCGVGASTDMLEAGARTVFLQAPVQRLPGNAERIGRALQVVVVSFESVSNQQLLGFG